MLTEERSTLLNDVKRLKKPLATDRPPPLYAPFLYD